MTPTQSTSGAKMQLTHGLVSGGRSMVNRLIHTMTAGMFKVPLSGGRSAAASTAAAVSASGINVRLVNIMPVTCAQCSFHSPDVNTMLSHLVTHNHKAQSDVTPSTTTAAASSTVVKQEPFSSSAVTSTPVQQQLIAANHSADMTSSEPNVKVAPGNSNSSQTDPTTEVNNSNLQPPRRVTLANTLNNEDNTIAYSPYLNVGKGIAETNDKKPKVFYINAAQLRSSQINRSRVDLKALKVMPSPIAVKLSTNATNDAGLKSEFSDDSSTAKLQISSVQSLSQGLLRDNDTSDGKVTLGDVILTTSSMLPEAGLPCTSDVTASAVYPVTLIGPCGEENMLVPRNNTAHKEVDQPEMGILSPSELASSGRVSAEWTSLPDDKQLVVSDQRTSSPSNTTPACYTFTRQAGPIIANTPSQQQEFKRFIFNDEGKLIEEK